jgi:hypothetical protein
MTHKIFLTIALIGLVTFSKANEGMWILPSIPDSIVKTMDKLGYELKLRDLYNEKRSSLKDVVVSFSNGYSGAIISSDGLLITNYSTIMPFIERLQESSQYKEEGFWATSYTREIPIENLTISILKTTENVTSKVLSHIPEFETLERKQQLIDSISQLLIEEKQSKTTHLVELRATNKGTQFHLYTYERFNDIRLVYAPPANIALFGEEKDKNSTPKHNANFALLRVYVSQENEPSMYDPFNKPYNTKQFAKISSRGYEMDDFVVSLGFPSYTNRTISSFALNEQIYAIHEAELHVALVKDKVWEHAMRESNYVKNLYERKYTQNSDRLTYLIQLQEAIKKQNIIAEKERAEKSFLQWSLKSDFNTMLKYEHVVPSLEKLYTSRKQEIYHLHYLTESFVKLDLLTVAYMLQTITPENEREIYREIAKFYERYDEKTEKRMLIAMLELYANQATNQFMPDIYTTINSKKYKGNISLYVDDIFKKSFITNEVRFNKYLDKPTEKQLNNDPIIILSTSILRKRAEIARVAFVNNREIEHLTALLIEGLQRKNSESMLLSDANYTLRMSYGTITTFSPSDGVFFGFTSNFEGIIEKNNTRHAAYKIDKRLIDIYQSKHNKKERPFAVSFLTSIDYTTDKMGAPVFDTEGYLIGILSDGNNETISNIYHYNERFQRTIALDIRYVLFILEHYAGTKRVIETLTIIDE